MIRYSISYRNIFLKKFAGLKLNQADHIRKQVPILIITHLKGITEFGLFWAINAAQYLINYLNVYLTKFDDFSEDFSFLIDNFKVILTDEFFFI